MLVPNLTAELTEKARTTLRRKSVIYSYPNVFSSFVCSVPSPFLHGYLSKLFYRLDTKPITLTVV